MIFQSTRSAEIQVNACQGILQGLAPDGGLFVGNIPSFPWQELMGKSSLTMAERILSFLLPGVENMDTLVEKAYTGRFESPELTPLVPVGNRYVLELFRGPTSAFKDVALSMLPQLITQARQQEQMQEEILILTATSGDTGKAALAGFRDVPGTRIIVFYPHEGVSAVQKAQMVTQEGENVCVCAVRGNFDDTQTGVKEIFAAGVSDDCGIRLSSANSINIGRLAPQAVYYFKAYSDLLDLGRISLGDKVDYVVPTGNFGDILAGYLAKCMGLPVGTLICASNCNDVLTDFLRTGVYDRRRPFHKTISPSMDILISSNLERLLYLLCKNPQEVAGYMKDLKEHGKYQVSEELLSQLYEDFACGCCDDEQTKQTIGRVWKEQGYLMDTHTAVAWHVAEGFQSENPLVVLSTASPYKFPAAVLSALGEEIEEDEFKVMEHLQELTGVPIPAGLKNLQEKPVLHTTVIDREEMHSFVLGKVEAWKK